jgi:hypothetical protein
VNLNNLRFNMNKDGVAFVIELILFNGIAIIFKLFPPKKLISSTVTELINTCHHKRVGKSKCYFCECLIRIF